MSPHELLHVLDDAIAAAPRGRRAIALELHAPGGNVLGIQGRFLGHTDRGPCYGFTRRQCETMRRIILEAAAEDVGQRTPAGGPVVDDYYTGDAAETEPGVR